MYSPKVREYHVQKLYKLKQVCKKPMTKLLAEALQKYLEEQEAINKNNQGGKR